MDLNPTQEKLLNEIIFNMIIPACKDFVDKSSGSVAKEIACESLYKAVSEPIDNLSIINCYHNYPAVQDLLRILNKLVSRRCVEHDFIKAILDKRLFTTPSNLNAEEVQELLVKKINNKIKEKIMEFLQEKGYTPGSFEKLKDPEVAIQHQPDKACSKPRI